MTPEERADYVFVHCTTQLPDDYGGSRVCSKRLLDDLRSHIRQAVRNAVIKERLACAEVAASVSGGWTPWGRARAIAAAIFTRSDNA